MVDAEDMPDDPPTPLQMRLAEWRNQMPHLPVERWMAREGGKIVDVAVTVVDTEQNLSNGFGRVQVHPDHRGRGLARVLATPVFDHLEQARRTRFDTWVKQGSPAEDLLERLGLKPAYQEKRSRLSIADLDLDLMDSWIERAGERAGDYELRYYLSPLSDEIVADFCDLAYIMNTAPREDFEADDEVLTPRAWRAIEKATRESQCQLHNLIAVHQPSGDFAGYTQIKTQDLQPDLAWQWDTGVHPDHRNKGLGRWLKAKMIRFVTVEYPALSRVDTYNAGSNESMLDINIAMGFRPVHVSQTWQGDLAKTRELFGA